jgi:hypothetical protein
MSEVRLEEYVTRFAKQKRRQYVVQTVEQDHQHWTGPAP